MTQAYAKKKNADDEAALAFKRFILEETNGFEMSPMADLFRVNLLEQMLNRYDALREMGVSVKGSVERVKLEYVNLQQMMREEGFEETDAQPRTSSRWPMMTESEAGDYLKESSEYQHRIGIGAVLCTACLLPLLLMNGLSELFFYYATDAAALLGVCGMFGMIGMGVYAIVTAKKPRSGEKVKRGRYSLGSNLRRKLSDLKLAIDEKSRRRMGRGVVMLVTCIVPIMLGAAMDSFFGTYSDGFAIMGVGGMFAMIGAGVYELIMADGEKKTIKKLLKNEKD